MKVPTKILLLTSLLSCSNRATKNDDNKDSTKIKVENKVQSIKKDKIDTVDNTVSDNNSKEIESGERKEIIKSDTIESNFNEDDCTFDLKTQTTEFIDTIPEFSIYTWDNRRKTATIRLADGDTLYASRGGCHHYEISGKLNMTENIPVDSVEIIIDKCKWIAKRIFHPADIEELESLLENKKYQFDKSDDRFRINFDHQFYLDYSIYAYRRKNGKLTIEIGYYMI